jgi:hypothetical protein
LAHFKTGAFNRSTTRPARVDQILNPPSGRKPMAVEARIRCLQALCRDEFARGMPRNRRSALWAKAIEPSPVSRPARNSEFAL